jgi:hypothetical protein
VIKGDAGNTVIDLAQYDFLKSTGEAPATVNPSLWRQSQLLSICGLFKVVDGIYQRRRQYMTDQYPLDGVPNDTLPNTMPKEQQRDRAARSSPVEAGVSVWHQWSACRSTMMLDDLRLLLSHTPPQAARADYTNAVVDNNVPVSTARSSSGLRPG